MGIRFQFYGTFVLETTIIECVFLLFLKVLGSRQLVDYLIFNIP